MPIRTAIRTLRSRALLGYIAATDLVVWLIGLPFELYCKHMLDMHRAGVPFLIFILLANAALLGMMATSAAGTIALAIRGLAFRRGSAT